MRIFGTLAWVCASVFVVSSGVFAAEQDTVVRADDHQQMISVADDDNEFDANHTPEDKSGDADETAAQDVPVSADDGTEKESGDEVESAGDMMGDDDEEVVENEEVVTDEESVEELVEERAPESAGADVEDDADHKITAQDDVGDVVDVVQVTNDDNQDNVSDDVQDDASEEIDHDDVEEVCVAHIVISAVMIGDGASSKNDAVVLRNDGACDTNLDDWQIKKRTASGSESSVRKFDAYILAPGEEFYWTNSAARFVSEADEKSSASLAKNNSIAVFDADKEIVDAIAWGEGLVDAFDDAVLLNPTEDEYIARDDEQFVIAQQCAHAVFARGACVAPYSGAQVWISEVLPNPSGDESVSEFVELYNPSVDALHLHGWTLRDASKTGAYIFPEGVWIAPGAYMVVSRTDFGFALNNSDESVSLIAPGGVVVDALVYAESAPEDVSYNRINQVSVESGYRWSQYVTPGNANRLNQLPQITDVDVSSKAYRDVRASFVVAAQDGDGGTLSYWWDFGDGHRSYKSETAHTYDATGTYVVTLRVSDGTESVTRTFDVKVKKYPRDHVVEIVAVMPNPDGKDTGTEYIVLKNTSDDDIDFGLWKIATGSSEEKLVNHTIRPEVRDDFVIDTGETAVVTSEYSAITLPNKGGVVRILRPDGSEADEVVYGIPGDAQSIPKNALYAKDEEGRWAWHIPATRAQSGSGSRSTFDVRALIARAWENEFGIREASESVMQSGDVAGAQTVRGDMVVEQWYTHVFAWINQFGARFVAHASHSGAANAVAQVDRSVLGTQLPHPSVMALEIVGLREKSD